MSLIILTFTSGCFFLLAFIVASNKWKVNILANRWFSIFLLCLGLILVSDSIVYELHGNEDFSILIDLFNLPVFVVGPLIYLSITFFVSPSKKLSFKEYSLHFLFPALLSFLIVLSYLMPNQEDLKEDAATLEIINIIVILVLIILPLTIYWLLSYMKLLRHQRNVYLFTSNVETIDLTWMRFFMWGLALMIIAWFCELVWENLIVSTISSIIYLISAFYLAYFALQQGEVFSANEHQAKELKVIIEENQQSSSTKKQLLGEDDLNILKKRLSAMMQDEKPYLDSTLNLSKLAQLMQVSTHELSYIINTSFEDNFFNFVNRYRVEESKVLLLSNEYKHLSMVGIAYEAGFNSKTAFNTAFKKMTGVSPTEFQKTASEIQN